MDDILNIEKILALPLALVVLIAILWFVLRVLPSWKEIKLAEIQVRETEATARTTEATMFLKLSDALNNVSDVIKHITVEQQKDTKNLEILQRVNADTSDKILVRLDALDQITEQMESNGKRLETLEEKCRMFEGKLKANSQE